MKIKKKALIVDDERLARIELKSLLSKFEEIEIVAEADSVDSAFEILKKLDIDLIFLDIQMPGKSGFYLLEQIEINAKIVFVTAYDEYAVKAFEVNALDYLLKPISQQRLAETINRITGVFNEKVPNYNLNYDDRLFLQFNSKYKFIKLNEIKYINSAGDYTKITLNSEISGLTNKSMNEWENRLPLNYFCRIHRTTIVNLEYIDKIEEWFEGGYRVYLKGDEPPLIISRRYLLKLKEILG
ncbi:MAG TPA: LytTR family DNA-binding domain-containing protein [Melioribacteraceae bacterium]|nr:LytTR family DNA-binding domain-containing protein [Melioribacteraceae bacterium]